MAYGNGHYNEFFDDVLVKASRNVASGLIDKIEPFHLNGLVDYKTQYLSGFLAEKYSIPLKEGWNDAKGIIDQSHYKWNSRTSSWRCCEYCECLYRLSGTLRTNIFYCHYGFHPSSSTIKSIAFLSMDKLVK